MARNFVIIIYYSLMPLLLEENELCVIVLYFTNT
jgi:hypothetical protein